jgi:hypothetical protein
MEKGRKRRMRRRRGEGGGQLAAGNPCKVNLRVNALYVPTLETTERNR